MARTLAKEKLSSMEAVQQAFKYPFFEALFNRRARRFPLGAEMPGGFNHFKSTKEPMPLDEVEEALLVTAGTGITGLNLSDLPFTNNDGKNWAGNTMVQFAGRTFPSACGSHGTELFYTNDDGCYMVKLKDVPPDKMSQFETMEDKDKIISGLREHTVKLNEGRLQVPQSIPTMLSFNTWNVNMPGTTLFTPISDVTWELINVMMLYFDDPHNMYIVDDMNNNAEPLKRWADEGKLNRQLATSLSAYERGLAVAIIGVEQGIIEQNMYLAAQSMGLGGWLFGGGASVVAMGGTPLTKGYGFRFTSPRRQTLGRAGMGSPNPVGIDGVFEGYCPPYYANMDAAVQAVYDAKWGSKGIYTANGGPAPYKQRQALDLSVPKTADWALQATKDLCSYIYDTYGKFPATLDSMNMSIWFQAHHLETDYYDEFYGPGAYHDAVANHMKVWHGK